MVVDFEDDLLQLVPGHEFVVFNDVGILLELQDAILKEGNHLVGYLPDYLAQTFGSVRVLLRRMLLLLLLDPEADLFEGVVQVLQFLLITDTHLPQRLRLVRLWQF